MTSSIETLTDLERIERFRRAGYGGSVSDALHRHGVTDTVLSDRFKPLRPEMQLVGRALPITIHTQLLDHSPEAAAARKQDPEHPQRKMMAAVSAAQDGSVLCFDCGGDMAAAHFGEMSCQLAYAQGARGMLIAGNCRDTQYVLRMPDFPLFSFGTRPNAYGNWMIMAVGEPILLRGHLTHNVPVHAGDFIFGDMDGVQVIPHAVVDDVLRDVEQTYEKENRERLDLEAGMPVEEVYRVYGVL